MIEESSYFETILDDEHVVQGGFLFGLELLDIDMFTGGVGEYPPIPDHERKKEERVTNIQEVEIPAEVLAMESKEFDEVSVPELEMQEYEVNPKDDEEIIVAKTPSESKDVSKSDSDPEIGEIFVAKSPSKDVAKNDSDQMEEIFVAESPSKDVAESPSKDVAESPSKDVAESPSKDVAKSPSKDVAKNDSDPEIGEIFVAKSPSKEAAKNDSDLEDEEFFTAKTPSKESEAGEILVARDKDKKVLKVKKVKKKGSQSVGGMYCLVTEIAESAIF